MDVTIALAVIGVGWAAISFGLRRSLRQLDVTEACAEHLAGKTAAWRRPAENRSVDKFALTHQGGRV